MRQRYELMKFDNYIGVYDTKTKTRLRSLKPKKRMMVRVPASAYESGYTSFESTDLHHRLKDRRTVSKKELEKLYNEYGE